MIRIHFRSFCTHITTTNNSFVHNIYIYIFMRFTSINRTSYLQQQQSNSIIVVCIMYVCICYMSMRRPTDYDRRSMRAPLARSIDPHSYRTMCASIRASAAAPNTMMMMRWMLSMRVMLIDDPEYREMRLMCR